MPAHLKDTLNNLQSDNSSLMRRLNLVLQELDRVKSEKDDIQTQLAVASKNTQDLQRQINSEDNVDKVNRYMQDDLAYERDRNQAARQKIKEVEGNQADTLGELRKAEDGAEQRARSNAQLTGDL